MDPSNSAFDENDDELFLKIGDQEDLENQIANKYVMSATTSRSILNPNQNEQNKPGPSKRLYEENPEDYVVTNPKKAKSIKKAILGKEYREKKKLEKLALQEQCETSDLLLTMSDGYADMVKDETEELKEELKKTKSENEKLQKEIKRIPLLETTIMNQANII